MRSIGRFLFLSFLLAVCHCGKRPVDIAGGGGSEGEAYAIVGMVVDENGNPAEKATVFLRPRDYLPNARQAKMKVSIDSTQTDSSGLFRIDSVDPGNFAIEVRGDSGYGLFVDSIHMPDTGGIVEMSTFSLRAVGEISGIVRIPANLYPEEIQVMAYGLDRLAAPDSTGRYTLPRMPAGTYSLRIQSVSDTLASIDTSGIWVPTGDAASVDTLGFYYLRFVSPDSNTFWHVDSTYTLRWETDLPGDLILYYAIGGSKEWFSRGKASADAQSIPFTVPPVQESKSEIRFKLREDRVVFPMVAFAPRPIPVLQLHPDPFEPNDTPEAAQTVSVGDTVRGGFTAAATNDVDYFRFTVKAGQRIEVALSSKRLSAQYFDVMELHDAGGRVQAKGNTRKSIQVNADIDTSFFLRIANSFKEGMRYELIIRELSPSAIRIDSPADGEVFVAGSLATVRWSTSLEGVLCLSYLVNDTSEWCSVTTVQASVGLLAWRVPMIDSTLSSAKIRLEEELVVSPERAESPMFTIQQKEADPYEPNESFDGAYEIQTGDTVSGAFITATCNACCPDSDYYRFTVTTGQYLEVLMESDPESDNSYCLIFDENRSLIGYARPGVPAFVRAGADGEYFLLIKSGVRAGAGYSIAITEKSPPQKLEIQSPKAGDVWKSESTYTIRWESDLDNGVAVYYAVGSEWVWIDKVDAAAGSLSWTTPLVDSTSSEVKVRIKEVAAGSSLVAFSDDFVLQQDRPDPFEPNNQFAKSTPVKVGDTVSGAFISPSHADVNHSVDRDYYTFLATNKKRIHIELWGRGEGQHPLELLELRLYDSEFSPLAERVSEGIVQLNAEKDSRYYVFVRKRILHSNASNGTRYMLTIHE